MPTAKVTKNVSAAEGGGNVLCSILISIKTKAWLYSFGHKGNGRNEYLMPTVIKNMPSNQFAFRDHATDNYATFLLTDSTAILLNETKHPVSDGRFFGKSTM